MSRRIQFETLQNTRDLGGMTGADGRKIRSGKLIRSGHLFAAGEKDKEQLSRLIDTSVDFRSFRECEEKPEPPIPGVRHIVIPILDEPKAGVTRDKASYEEIQSRMLSDPEVSRKYMEEAYTGFITSGFSRKQYRHFIDLLLEDHEKGILWHCTAGKDRAGFAAVIVQELLGVSRKDITEDYLMTNTCLEGELKQILSSLAARTGSYFENAEKELRYMFEARQDYLETSYAKAEECFGSFDGYLSEGLGITPEEREKLKELYLEPVP